MTVAPASLSSSSAASPSRWVAAPSVMRWPASPSYYRSVFRGGGSPDFDPIQVGIGLGVSQGLIAGLVAGSVVVLAVGLSGWRRAAKEPLDLV